VNVPVALSLPASRKSSRMTIQEVIIHQRFLSHALFFRFEGEAGRNAVLIHAFAVSVGMGLQRAILALFDCVDEDFCILCLPWFWSCHACLRRRDGEF